MPSNLMILSLIIIVTFMELGIQGQCIDCSREWKIKCNTGGVTNWVCNASSEMEINQPGKPHDVVGEGIYSSCSPSAWDIKNVGSFCCIYSPETGCQLALAPRIYDLTQTPIAMCSFCKERCRCLSNGSSTMHISLSGLLLYWVFKILEF